MRQPIIDDGLDGRIAGYDFSLVGSRRVTVKGCLYVS